MKNPLDSFEFLERCKADTANEIQALQRALESAGTKAAGNSWELDPKTGYPVSRSRSETPEPQKISLSQFLAIMEQANEDEALNHAGISR